MKDHILATPDAASTYLDRIQLELTVLPAASRREIYQSISEHVRESHPDVLLEKTIGDPAAITRAALEDLEATSGKTARPSFAMRAKQFQLAALIVFSLQTVIGVIDSFDGSFMGLLRAIPLALIFLPPLLVSWRRWKRVSFFALIGFIAFAAVSLIVGATNAPVNLLGTVFLLGGPLFRITTAISGILLLAGLVVRAPASLRETK